MRAVAGDRPEVLPAIAQRRLTRAERGQLAYRPVERMLPVEGVRLAPQRLAHRLRRGACAVQPLLGAVVQAGDALQREQARHAQRQLPIVTARVGRVAVVEAAVLVVVIQEGHEVAAGLAVGADDPALHLLAPREHLADRAGRQHPLGRGGQVVEEREVQRRVHPGQVAGLQGLAADEACDLLFVVVHLAEGEEVTLADALRVLANGVAEDACELRLDVLERVDPIGVHVVAGDQVLVGTDEGVAHGVIRSTLGRDLAIIGDQFLEGKEVARCLLLPRGPVESVSAAAQEIVSLQLLRPEARVSRRLGRKLRPVGPAAAVGVPPADRVGCIAAPRGQAAAGPIGEGILEHVAGMVQHDVEDHVHAAVVRRVHQRPQFSLDERRVLSRFLRVRRQARVDGDEVLDAVAVVARLELAILHHRRQPQRARAQLLQIIQLLPDAVQRAALERAVAAVPREARRARRVVEPVHEDEIDPRVTPVGGGREGRGEAAQRAHVSFVTRSRVLQRVLDAGIPNRVTHDHSPTGDCGRIYLLYKHTSNLRREPVSAVTFRRMRRRCTWDKRKGDVSGVIAAAHIPFLVLPRSSGRASVLPRTLGLGLNLNLSLSLAAAAGDSR